MRNNRTGVLALVVGGLAVPAFAGIGTGPLSPTSLYLRAGTVDTSLPVALDIAAARAERCLIQLDGPITPARRAALVGAGVRLGDYLPSNAYIADLSRADPKAVGVLGFVRWWSPWRTEWKLDPELGQRRYATPARVSLSKRGRDQLTLALFTGADPEAAKKAAWGVPGAKILAEDAIADHIELTVETGLDSTKRLALIPGVQFIEPAPEATPRSNYTTRWIVQSNVAGSFPLYDNGLHGEGQVVGILDGRVDAAHCSFLDSNPPGPTHRKIAGMQSTGAADLHGTHVAGIAVGNNPAGADTDNTRGVAYLGKLSWGTYGSAANGSGDVSDFITGLNYNRGNGAHIHTNSWGNDGTTNYDALCRAIDDQSYANEGDLICFAVTNQSTLKNPENAKSVLAVGNDQDSPTQTTICTGGAGPTSDGRRKPEIWAPGCSTLSSQYNTACGTTALTGTSMASPAIAGTAMLVRQYYMGGYHPLGIAGSGPTITPSGALLRATLMNTGQDMTAAASGFQTPTGYPSPQEGWGRVKADDALYFSGDSRKLRVVDKPNAAGLSTNGEDDVALTVLGSGQQLRITLSWTEPPAAAGAANAAVNDLDLVVEGPAGTYLGNVFNTASGQSAPGGVKDAINSTEQVHIPSPPPGVYTVRIKGANVAQGTQGYALVMTGDIQRDELPALWIELPSGTPGLVPPGAAFSVPVSVRAGTQNIQGAPLAWYRSSAAGSFVSAPLVSLGGSGYRADLPAPSCSGTPQFYFTAQGDGGGSAESPSGAPASFYSTQVGVTSTTTLLSQSFESAPAGWSISGLWHIGGTCAPGGSCDGTRWAYYGVDGTCTFNVGGRTSGSLTSPAVGLPQVPPGGSITLTYCSAKLSENNATYDRTTVLVNGTTIDTAGEAASFETRTADLTAYAGQTVTLSWFFDSVDGTLNDYRGWHVDNIRITATGTSCTDVACYANCDGSTAPPAVNTGDFTCFLQQYSTAVTLPSAQQQAHYANCDGSTTFPQVNTADFTCFLQKYAAGCS